MSEPKIKNMEEFAAASGISRPTVSKYFYDPDSVRPKTRARIEAALQQFDYRPNIYAMNQNRRLTKNIGIVVPYLADPFFAEIARNVEQLVIDAGFRPILLSSHGDRQQELSNLESLRSIKPAGVLMAPLGRRSDIDAVTEFCVDVPTVLFDSNIEGAGEAFIGSDNMQSIDMMVAYLCDGGDPPVFFGMRTPTNPNANKRRQSYRKAMENRGLQPEFFDAGGEGWDFEEIGFREGMRAITSKALPTNTVLCSNDRLAIGLLSAAFETGLRVGRGPGCALRVAGHDDHPFSRYTSPRLTTVSQDYAAIAKKSVETLLHTVLSGEHGSARETTLFHGRLVPRTSA
ncbi:MAG: LacI family DNA-binding transcriptional regulator [Pseudomonadota bacterium]